MFDLFLLWICSIVHDHAYLMCDASMEYDTWTLHNENESCCVAGLFLLSLSSSRSLNSSCCLPWSFSLSPWAQAQIPLATYFGPPFFLLELLLLLTLVLFSLSLNSCSSSWCSISFFLSSSFSCYGVHSQNKELGLHL
jgi:hypothetical protein